MPRQPKFPPSILPHRPSGRDRIRWRGKDYWLGPIGSEQSRRRYAELVAQIQRTGAAGPAPADLTVAELADWWADWSARNYPAGSTAPRQGAGALKPLVALFADLPARELSPRRLKEYQRHVTAAPPAGPGWCRNHANRAVVRVKTAVKRAVEEELLPGAVYEALRCVRAVPPGAPGVAETAPVAAAGPGDLALILPHCPAPVAGMLELQALTGMRSKEVRLLRPCDVDRSGEVWVYRPAGGGKTAHKGHKRAVALGPRAQALLAPWLLKCPADDAYCFPPSAAPKTRGRKGLGACYTEQSYPRAVARAAAKAGLAGFHPYRCRHAYRNAVLQLGGVAGALAALGQKSTRALDQYGGGQDLKLATEMAKKLG